MKRSKHSTSGNKLSSMNTAVSDDEEMDDIMFLLTDTEESVDMGKGKATGVVVL